MCRVFMNNYSHVSQEQQKSMSKILCGSTSMVQTGTHSLVETRKHQSPTPTAAGLFNGAVLYGGRFHYQYQLVPVFNRRT